jgi:hypothetical protein
MKVVERFDTSEWRHTFVCSRCDSKLEADPKDLVATKKSTEQDMRGLDKGAFEWAYHVTCPVCLQKSGVSTQSIPKLLQYEAQQRTERVRGGL